MEGENMIPVIKVADRNISVAGFEFQNQNGATISLILQRSYKSKKTGEWVSESINCFEDDLLKIANLCQKAYNTLCEKRVQQQPQQAPTSVPTPAQPKVETPTQDQNDDIPF